MVLRHALLGLLAARPWSGYELTRVLSKSLAYVWPVKHSQVYPELSRLLRDGLIEQKEEGPRRKKVYGITAAGRREVTDWLRTTEPSHDSRNEALLRVFLLWLLTPPEAADYLRSETAFHRQRLAELTAIAAEPPAALPAVRYSQIMLEWGLRYHSAIIEWLEWATTQAEKEARASKAS
jgi:PadR family transcriptional regulator, regulatory protein AphA